MKAKQVTLCTSEVDVFPQSSFANISVGKRSEKMMKTVSEEAIRSKSSNLINQTLPLTEEQIKLALTQSIMTQKFSSFFCIPSSIFQRQKKKGLDVKNFSSKSAFHVSTYIYCLKVYFWTIFYFHSTVRT